MKTALSSLLSLLLAVPALAGPVVPVTGTWQGTIPLDGLPRPMVVQLHQRADGSVMGYVLGGAALTVTQGAAASGGRLTLRLERIDPSRTAAVTVTARLRGGRIRGTADEGTGPQAISWTQVAGDVCERRLALADTAAEPLTEIAVATDCRGTFLAGAFAGRDACGFPGCAGTVDSFTESAGVIDLRLESGVGPLCPRTSSVHATFDPASKTYHGAWSLAGCHLFGSGSALAARWSQARASDVRGIFATLGRIADDLEARRPFASPYAPVSASYLHLGEVASDLLSELRDETRRPAPLDVDFSRFRGFRTVADPDAFPDLDGPLGVDFHDRRTAAGAVYRDADTDFAHSELKFLRPEAGGWKVFGNQAATPFDLPFVYSPTAEGLDVPVTGEAVHVSVGPWGAHFPPLTGHSYGDPKANFAGFFSDGPGDLREIPGDGVGDDDGVCEPGEACAVAIGAAELRDRTPTYVAPMPGVVTAVEFRGPDPAYFDGAQRWAVHLRLDAGLEIQFDHLARIAPGLRALVRDRTGIDPDTYSGPEGDLLHGATIRVPAGTQLAQPQVFASEVPGHPGLYRGGGSFDRPWAQMELFVTDGGRETCLFDLLPAGRRAAIQAAMSGEMADPAAQRYAGYQPLRWTWAAEGLLCPTAPPQPDGLFSNLGGWFEVPGGTGAGAVADELFAILPVARTAPSWNPALYSTPKLDSLVLRRKRTDDPTPFTWKLPDGSAATPFYPNGEVLERTGTPEAGKLLLRWRDVGRPELFQRAAFRIDGGRLQIRWGGFAFTAAAAPNPAIPTVGTPCDGERVVCYSQEHRPGF